MTSETATMTHPTHTWVKWVLVAAPLAIVAFLTGSGAPLGGFWAPSPDTQALIARATGLQTAGFLLLQAVTGATFGFGVAFLLFGYHPTSIVSPALARAVHLSISWLLISWWAHGSLHMHYQLSTPGTLLALEYGFHVTLMVVGAILAYFFAKVVTSRG